MKIRINSGKKTIDVKSSLNQMHENFKQICENADFTELTNEEKYNLLQELNSMEKQLKLLKVKK